MNNITKKTAFGITTVAAGALLVGGFAAPAMAASDTDSSTSTKSTTSSASQLNDLDLQALRDLAFSSGDLTANTPLVLAPSVGNIGGGDLNVGDIASGNPIASGNEITAPVTAPVEAPIASGNETALGSGNDTAVGNGSANGNTADVSDVVTDVVDVPTEVSDVVEAPVQAPVEAPVAVSPETGTDLGSELTDVVDVEGILDGVTNSVNLDSILGR
jgi:hypothetical protein